jgi:heptosyltransferase-2
MKTQGPVLAYMPDRGIGDLMWHLPTIRAIAAQAPSGRVILATRPATRAAEVLAVEPAIERVEYLTYHAGPWKTLREIADFYRLCRRLRPGSVWIMEKIGRPAQAAWLAGVPDRRGFGLGHASQERWLSRGPKLPKSMRKAHRIEKLMAFEALNGLTVESREPELKVDAKQVAAVAAQFADRPKPWVVFGPGAVDDYKCWPMENFARLADLIAPDAGTIFWLGGPADAERFAAGLQRVADPARSRLTCDLTLDASAALISQSSLFIGNDSGPMNLAAAAGTPAIGLFGRTPLLSYSRWLEPIVSPTGDLRDIEPAEAVAAVRRHL